jgi:hypothetical protein
MAFGADGTTAPTIVNSSVARTREYLTGAEVEELMAAARKSSRYRHRDATMILIAHRHGLRASELLTCNGTRSSLTPDACTSAGRSAAGQAFTRSRATNCGPCVVCSANNRLALMSSLPSGAARSRRRASTR